MECFDDVLCEVKKLPKEERSLIGEAVILCNLLAVNPATSACFERSFFSSTSPEDMAEIEHETTAIQQLEYLIIIRN